MEGTYKWGDQVVVSSEAKDLVRLLIENDPKKRISLDEALEHRWFKILDAPRKAQRKAVTRTTQRSKYSILWFHIVLHLCIYKTPRDDLIQLHY